MRLLHLSDLHFGTVLPEVSKACAKTIRSLKAIAMVWSGDITQRARQIEFAEAKSFLEQLQIPDSLVITGNHDLPLDRPVERFLRPYHMYERFFPDRSPFLITPELIILGVDATSRFRHTKGKVPLLSLKSRLNTLKQSVDFKNQALAIAVHQPPVTAWSKDSHEILINTPAFVDLCHEQQIDLVMTGHVHVPLVGVSNQFFASQDHNFILSGAGTATSWRTRTNTPNSFHVIDLEKRKDHFSIKIERFEYKAEENLFIPVEKHSFLKQSGLWITQTA